MDAEVEGSGELDLGRAWVAAIRGGDFEAAWALSDRHLQQVRASGQPVHAGPRHEQSIWRGEQLNGRRVLVRCYHGLGDTIQFARFLRPLREIAREVIVWCQPELMAIIQATPGVDRALPLHDGVCEAEFDVDIEIMELAHALRAGRVLIGMREPYLRRPASTAAAPLAGGELAVGLVWQVGDWDKRRAVPAEMLGRLRVDGVRLYSLQRGPAAKAAIDIGVQDISTPDIGTLARRIAELDLVISVDTMVAHLTGALGCEGWVLLHADCDWRWPQAGGSTLWDPSLRLFHQRRAGEWQSVIEVVRAALIARVAGQSRVIPSASEAYGVNAVSEAASSGALARSGIRASTPMPLRSRR
jgi:hypothetical protein